MLEPSRDGPLDRIARLEEQIARLTDSLAAVQARLTAIDGGEGASSAPAPEAATLEEEASGFEVPALLTLLGRTSLVLGGAFLIRALTESAVVPKGLGAAAGIAYALAFLVLADRAASRGERASAALHGLSSALVAYPLVWETVTRYAILSALGAAVALAVLTALVLAVAVRRSLAILAWTGTVAALASGVALAAATRDLAVFAPFLVLLCAAVVVVSERNGWNGLGWLPSLGADAIVGLMISLSSRAEGPPDAYRDLSPGVSLAVASSLPLVTLIAFRLRSAERRGHVTPLEAFQTPLALLVGLGGAVRIVRAHDQATLGLAAVMLALAAAGYLEVLRRNPVDLASRLGNGFRGAIALSLALAGATLLPFPWIAVPLWCLLALGAGGLSERAGRPDLAIHACAFLLASSLNARLPVSVLDAFLAGTDSTESTLRGAGLLVLATALVLFVILRTNGSPAVRIARLFPGLVLVAGLGAIAVTALLFPFGGPGQASGAATALARTAVLAFAAVALASLRGRPALADLSWLAYPLLLAGGLKILFDDLGAGRAATLFVALALYGAALIFVPRLLRKERATRPG